MWTGRCLASVAEVVRWELGFWTSELLSGLGSAVDGLILGFQLLRILLFLGAVALLVYAIASHFLDSI